MSVVYDVETYINCFLLSAKSRGKSNMYTWEISERRNDIRSLLGWFEALGNEQIPMIGFNNIAFDYPICHFIIQHGATVTARDIYEKAQSIIANQNDRFANIIWERDRFVPQGDLLLIHHFDNIAKKTSLKKLQFNMKAESVEDLPFSPHTALTPDQIPKVIGYNRHDVDETDRFAEFSKDQLDFREELKSQLNGDVMNFNDTKIGKQYFIQELGEGLCYFKDGSNKGRKTPRQTFRENINLGEIIFPYIHYHTKPFQDQLAFFKQQVITDTRGVFNNVFVELNGFRFDFGTGGIHGSVDRRKVVADADFEIVDIDVTSLYPSIAIVNKVFPAHLGEIFVVKYEELKRRRLQYLKGSTINGTLKLALNGVYGDSNNVYSPFYDPQYTMTITINGQLLLCMLAEWLILGVPGIELIQINTDGITARVPRDSRKIFDFICKDWERFTCLDLEYATYSRMFVRDVNNYLAEKKPGSTKVKGAYFYPRSWKDYTGEWDMDFSEMVVPRAAEAAMLFGVDPADFIRVHPDKFDFMLCAKVDRKSKLFIGDKEVQRTTRYFVSQDGAPMVKVSPPTGEAGTYCRKSGISELQWITGLRATPPGEWNPEIHTKNKSRYGERRIGIAVDYLTTECNHVASFDWRRVDFNYYVEQTKKLIIT